MNKENPNEDYQKILEKSQTILDPNDGPEAVPMEDHVPSEEESE